MEYSSSIDDRHQLVQRMQQLSSLIIEEVSSCEDAGLAKIRQLDSEMRQFFDIISPQHPVTSAELSILEDVGAILNRAKTLAATQRQRVLEELKQLRVSRAGITAYESATASH